MNWVDHAIWWHVYPLGFAGAPIRAGEGGAAPSMPSSPGLLHLIPWLDYAVDLGLSGLLLGPIFASETHGYDSLDQYRIDPRLGDEGDFDKLVAECKKRGLRIVLDGVFSHVGHGHPLVAQALREGPDSAAAQLIDIDWDHSGGAKPRFFEGHDSLVRLNHSRPDTVAYTRDVMMHWLRRGIDGWRLDAAYSVSPHFWRQVLEPVRRDFPEAWFLAEVIHGNYSQFVVDSDVDSVTQYELWKAIWSSLLDDNFFELDWSLKRHGEFLDVFVPNTFIGNHDVTRIATTLGADRAVVALMILMTVGGIPSVYYGDEQGFTGTKEERAGGDDAVRPPMPSSPGGLLPLGAPIHACYRDLIGLRRRHPWLTTARTQAKSVDNRHYVYETRSADGAHFLTVDLDTNEGGRCVILSPDGTVLWGKPQIKG